MMLGLYLVLGILIYLMFKNNEDFKSNKSKGKCINCGKEVDNNFVYCPYCQEQLKKKCDKCGRLIESDWRYCPFCEGND